MGRLWLSLAFLVAFVAPAFAVAPHVPATPRIKRAYLEIGAQRTSAGLYDVTLLQLDADLDRYAATVRITLRTAAGEELTVETTPDQLRLSYPKLLAPVGTSHLVVTSISKTHIESEPAEIDVVASHAHPMRCGEIFAVVLLVGGGFGLVLMLVVLLIMSATERTRARIRGDTEPTGLAQPAAEAHIRSVALHALLALVVVAAIVVVSIGMDAAFVPIFTGPILLIVALHAILRVVNAGRAIQLLHQPGAQACTRYDQLEVALDGRHVSLRSSPSLVARARRHALPKATL